MWPWRPKKGCRRRAFWKKLFIFSSSLHLIILFFIFFIYWGDSFVYKINVNRAIIPSGAHVVFLPLQKVVGTNISTIVSVKEKKRVKTTTSLVQPKIKKQAEKKKEAPKKPVVKKNKDKGKKETVKKVPEKKCVEKKEQTPPKKQEIMPKKPLKATQEKDSGANHDEKKIAIPEPVYIGRFEREALQMQEAIEHEVAKCWKPPVGLSKDLSCTIKVFVGWDGAVQKVTMIKQSGILMYDIAARRAATRLMLPKVAHGKEIEITFNQ